MSTQTDSTTIRVTPITSTSPQPPPTASSSVTTTPAPIITNTNTTTNNEQNEDVNDWRKSVSQAQRSQEVRDISRVLSSLEPGSTPAQKLMLAMRFEEQFFKACSSHEEYRKKLMKRLKKLQKTYKPPPTTASAAPNQNASMQANTGRSIIDENIRKKAEEEAVERELRELYGDKLLYIIEHANEALVAMKKRQGEKGASLLKQHIDNVAQWTVEIGAVPESFVFYGGETRKRGHPRAPNYLNTVRKFLDQTVNTIRCNIMKLIDPDGYLLEELIRIETKINGTISKELTDAVLNVDSDFHSASQQFQMKPTVERASKFVLPPRKSNELDVKNAKLSQLSKIRAAVDLISSIITVKVDFEAKPDILQKMHGIVKEGLTFLDEHTDNSQLQNNIVLLEDAWNNEMEYKEVNSPPDSGDDEDLLSIEPSAKRQKTVPNKTVLRSKVLLKPGRNISSSLLRELESKKARYLRPTKLGAGARLQMTFGSAFEMIVFLSPLLVQIRALPSDAHTNLEQKQDERNDSNERCGLPLGKPPCTALSTKALAVSGVKGSYSTVGCIVAKKLEYASAKATHVLRRCFADLVGSRYAKQNCSDFEIEVAETSALLKFLQTARETYSKDNLS